MSRNLDSFLAAALPDSLIWPCFLVQLTFRSETVNAWTGIGTLVADGISYLGTGSLGTISAISEASDVKADGLTLTLSGIDPALLADSLTDIQIGASAKVYFGLMASASTLIGSYLVFSGTIDKPQIRTSVESLTISLALENRLVNLSRANQRRYTSADQRIYFPTDMAFNWVEILNDIALLWGSS
jgi:hypothetical protein